MTIIRRDGTKIEDADATWEEIVEDIRLRILYAPKIPGPDRLAFPPVDWAKVMADEAAEADWQDQFEDDVKSGKFDKS